MIFRKKGKFSLHMFERKKLVISLLSENKFFNISKEISECIVVKNTTLNIVLNRCTDIYLILGVNTSHLAILAGHVLFWSYSTVQVHRLNEFIDFFVVL